MSEVAGNQVQGLIPIRGGVGLVGLAVAASAAILGVASWLDESASGPTVDAGLEAQARYGELPLAFEPNAGRFPGEVLFTTRTAAGTLALTSTGATISAQTSNHDSESIQIQFPGADLSNATGAERLPGVVNDLRGDRSDWKTEIPTYGAVAFPSAYPGTEIRFHGSSQEQFEYDFLLAAGADPSTLTTRIEGAEAIRLNGNGALVASAGEARFTQQTPIAYQPADAQNPRVEVDAAFSLEGNRVGFELGAYDPGRELVIDPVVLAYSTYLGGSGSDAFSGIAIDPSGAAYGVGESDSPDFDRVGGIEGDSTGFDVVVSKLAPAGNALVYSTYLGGSGLDDGQSIAVDSAGAAYVAGGTDSSDFNTVNAIQASKGLLEDVFVAKLTSAGSALVYSTYLGGVGQDRAEGIAVNSGGAAYVTGLTGSGNFPTANPIQATLAGSSDGFVSKLTPAGNALDYSTYLGGGGNDESRDIKVDSTGAAYITGATSSGDFPIANAIDASLHGSSDAFVSKLNPAGNALAYSTYLGGELPEGADSIAVDANGAAYVTGDTPSTSFPTVNPIEGKSPGGFSDVFVSKLNPAGSALAYSTYLGGTGVEAGLAIAVDGAGSAYVAGLTGSTDFDTVTPIEGDSPAEDVFVSKLTPAGNALDFSTYIGGGDDDRANGIAVDSAGGVYIAGSTLSSDFDTVGPIEGDSSTSDGFISKLVPDGDGDGVADSTDNCPAAANPGQADLDGDAQGDACDSDSDGDGIENGGDACPAGVVGVGSDLDGDGCKDSEDADDDADGVEDVADACPALPAPTGCPELARRLRLSYDDKDNVFKGKLSPKGACTAKVRVAIFRAKPGKDSSIGRATTKSNGSFRKAASPPEGSYYAKVKPKTIPDVVTCLAAKSKKVAVKDRKRR